jgi:hypothetical protein
MPLHVLALKKRRADTLAGSGCSLLKIQSGSVFLRILTPTPSQLSTPMTTLLAIAELTPMKVFFPTVQNPEITA